MDKKIKIISIVLILITILISAYFLLLFEGCNPKDTNKRIIVDISHSYTNPSEISDFVNYLDCKGWYVYVLDDSEISLKDFINEKKPNVTIIFNDWYEPFFEEDEEALFEFIKNGGGFLYLKPRGSLNLSRIGYFGEYGSQIFLVPKENMNVKDRFLEVDTNFYVTNFTDYHLFRNVERLPFIGSLLNVTDPFEVVAWTGENTFHGESAECYCAGSGCDCLLNDSTWWGPFPVIAKAEYGDGKVIITSGPEAYIENGSFRDSNVKNFLMNALESFIK